MCGFQPKHIIAYMNLKKEKDKDFRWYTPTLFTALGPSLKINTSAGKLIKLEQEEFE